MKKDFDEEKAKIIITILPFVLILLILAGTFLVRTVRNKDSKNSDELQESIMEYADENKQDPEESVIQEKEMEPPSPSLSAASPSPETQSAEETAKKESPSPAKTKQKTDSSKKIDYSKISFNKEEQLKEMMSYWADGNQAALDDLAHLDRFLAMSYSLKDGKDCYYYGDLNAQGVANGRGIAVYGGNQYYYGDWKNGVRSGEGTFIHYHIAFSKNEELYTYHQYTGHFENDLPDGAGSEHFDFEVSGFKPNTRYVANRIGSYHAGLINGDFYLTTTDSSENYEEWKGTAKDGAWIYQNSTKDKKGNRAALVDVNDPDNYIWILPAENKEICVPCLISKNR